LVDALAENVQLPGPWRGTSTEPMPGPRVPESSPLSAFAFNVGAAGLSLVVVTLEKFLSTHDVVDVVLADFAVSITLVDGVVVGELVVVFGTKVVAGDVEEGGGDETSGARGTEFEVRVKTRIRSKSGLDHIKR
jgi:hypothetical protein